MKQHDLTKILIDMRWIVAEKEGDAGIIEYLDFYLEQWLFNKNHCPNCGSEF